MIRHFGVFKLLFSFRVCSNFFFFVVRNHCCVSLSMSGFFWGVFVVLVVVVLVFKVVTPASNTNTNGSITETFSNFQMNFLFVYLTAFCKWSKRRGNIKFLFFFFLPVADWLQGPYVYALYQSYGFEPNEIAQLFVAGFLSSAIFGTFVGSLADK